MCALQFPKSNLKKGGAVQDSNDHMPQYEVYIWNNHLELVLTKIWSVIKITLTENLAGVLVLCILIHMQIVTLAILSFVAR